MTITVTARPYVLTFKSSSFLLTSTEAQRLIDAYPAVRATPNRVVLAVTNSGSYADRSTVRPATLGGGAAFIVTR